MMISISNLNQCHTRIEPVPERVPENTPDDDSCGFETVDSSFVSRRGIPLCDLRPSIDFNVAAQQSASQAFDRTNNYDPYGQLNALFGSKCFKNKNRDEEYNLNPLRTRPKVRYDDEEHFHRTPVCNPSRQEFVNVNMSRGSNFESGHASGPDLNRLVSDLIMEMKQLTPSRHA